MTVLHVAFGTLALIVAPAAMFARKRGAWHRRWGVAFTIAMGIVLFSAGFLWQTKGHLFLVPLSGVSAFLLFNGWRSIARHKRRRRDEIEDRIDILADCAAIAAGIATAYIGGTASTPLLMSIKPALIAVGGIAIAFAVNDIVGFRQPRLRSGWLLGHFSAMIASYISAVTAFIVINAHHVPMMLRWIIPSAVGVVVIAFWTMKTVRFALPARQAAAQTRSRTIVANARRLLRAPKGNA